nr:hypothetical protein [Tanacetum cinerariifolium]
IPACCDDDDDYNSTITPVLSTKEPVDSLSMGDENLDTILAMESDKVIKYSVEDLVSIPSESEGILDTMCDVYLVKNPTPLEAKDHFEIVTKSNDDISSSDDDSLYNENTDYDVEDDTEDEDDVNEVFVKPTPPSPIPATPPPPHKPEHIPSPPQAKTAQPSPPPQPQLQMNNNIIAASSRDRPPMLTIGRYLQWRSWFLQYIDTIPNGDALRKCILNGPYKPNTILVQAVTRSDTDRTLKVQTADSQITQLTEQVTNFQAQNDLFRAKNDKIKQHYKELYDSIKITRVKHIEQVTALTTENVNLKAQILEKVNNVKTIRDIVEEAKFVRPLDRSIVSACRYTKHSQELLEYVIGTCPQDSLYRDKQLAHIPLIRRKQVTFANPSDTSNSNTHKPVAKVHTQKTNVPVPPSTRVKRCTNASGSQPRSNTKKNRITPAKGVNKLPVEEQSRTNKSLLRTSNRVDSSSRIKRTECKKPKRVKDSAYHKEKMLLCKHAEKGVPLQAEQYDLASRHG